LSRHHTLSPKNAFPNIVFSALGIRFEEDVMTLLSHHIPEG